MGQYAPDDSRDVTLSSDSAPGEPERTGPREGETRRGEHSRAQKNQDSSHTDGQPREGDEHRRGEGPVGQ